MPNICHVKQCKARKRKKGLTCCCLPNSFLVMETPEINTQDQTPRSPTPTQDEEMAKVPMASLTLEKMEYRSTNVDDSFHDKKGIIIQFLNSSCPGTPSVIGGIRINLEDIKQVPLYLQQNRDLIKQHAAKVLLDHWRDLNYGIGCNETISIDDFGLTFTVGSVAHNALKINPQQKNEGPLFYCHFPALVEPHVIVHTDWGTQTEGKAVHFINGYISLLPPHQRRNVLMRKDREDKAAASAAAAAATLQARTTPVTLPPTGYTGATIKKSRPQPYPTVPGPMARPVPYAARPQHIMHHQHNQKDAAVLREEMNNLHALISKVQSQIIPSPRLPTPKTPIWPRQHQGPDLPDGL